MSEEQSRMLNEVTQNYLRLIWEEWEKELAEQCKADEEVQELERIFAL